MAKQTRGFCKYCGKEYTKGGMLRHLAACKKRKEILENEDSKRKCGYFQIVISGKYDKDYWLIIEMSEDSTLEDLDEFIRDIWVECCGHLSAFMINGIQYENCEYMEDIWGYSVESTECKLKEVISVGDIVTYEYDFGSTTELLLSIHSYRIEDRKEEKIIILSRNNPLEIKNTVMNVLKNQILKEGANKIKDSFIKCGGEKEVVNFIENKVKK